MIFNLIIKLGNFRVLVYMDMLNVCCVPILFLIAECVLLQLAALSVEEVNLI